MADAGAHAALRGRHSRHLESIKSCQKSESIEMMAT